MSEFSQNDKNRLKTALAEYLRVTDPDIQEAIATEMLETGVFRTFGFGSLIKVPFSDAKATKYDGRLDGEVMRFNAAWINYGGTEEFKNLILGLEESEGGSTPGVVSENNIFEIAGERSVDAIISVLKDWQRRENPENSPSYRFGLKAVQPMENGQPVGEPVMAVACIADEEGPFFVGDALTLEQKAMILASEFGDDRQRAHNGLFNEGSNQTYHHKSIRNYLLDCLDARLQKGFPIERELVDLVKATNYFRRQMPTGEQAYMEQRESGLLDPRDVLEPKVSYVEGLRLVAERTEQYTEEYISARAARQAKEGGLSGEFDGNSRELSVVEQNAINLRVFRELNREVSGIDEVLYDLCANGPELTSSQFYGLQWQARNALRAQIDSMEPDEAKRLGPLKDLPVGYDMKASMPELDYSRGLQTFNMGDGLGPRPTSGQDLKAG